MSASASGLGQQALELRSSFDRGFAAPRHVDDAVKHDLLAIRVDAEAFAVRLTEIAGLFAGRRITRVPGGNAALLGIAGFRGTIMPVYSLRALFGQVATHTPHWLVIAAAAPLAVAFDAFEGHLRAAPDAFLPRQSGGQIGAFAPEFLRAGNTVRAVVCLASVIEALGAMEAKKPAPELE